MTTSGPVDYTKTCFVHPTLTKVHGEPHYSSLKELKNQLKANASSVTLDLGGGGHGHLGLVLTPHAMILAVPYIRPLYPGNLNILPGTSQHQVTRLTLAHAEAKRTFRETVQLEKTLMNQLCNALEETYYKEKISLHTNTIVEPLSTFLTWLFTTYGDIDCETIKDEEKRVLNITYDLHNPITDVSEPIQDLK